MRTPAIVMPSPWTKMPSGPKHRFEFVLMVACTAAALVMATLPAVTPWTVRPVLSVPM